MFTFPAVALLALLVFLLLFGFNRVFRFFLVALRDGLAATAAFARDRGRSSFTLFTAFASGAALFVLATLAAFDGFVTFPVASTFALAALVLLALFNAVFRFFLAEVRSCFGETARFASENSGSLFALLGAVAALAAFFFAVDGFDPESFRVGEGSARLR